MRVLITGGAGFIGSSLALALLAQGDEVTVLDALTPQIHGNDPERESPLYIRIKEKVNFLRGSVTDASIWPTAIARQDAIVHLAAETGTGQSMYEIYRYTDVNVGGTALMLEYLAKNQHQVKRIVVASTRALYGEGKYRASDGRILYPEARRVGDMQAGLFELYDDDHGALESLPTDEDAKIHPSSVYGITKQSQEQLVMTMGSALGVSPIALRYQNVYGPGQSLSNPYTGILSIFSTRIRHGRSIQIFEDGLESRDFVYIDDIVEATRAALMLEGAGGQVFGIGSGIATSVRGAVETLVSHFGRSVPIEVTGTFRLGDIRHNRADIAKARNLLGYEPKVSFEEGLGRFAQWAVTQSLQPDRYEASLSEMKEKGLMRG